MKPYHWVLYTKKNLQHRSITTKKYIKIRQPRTEIEGVSKKTLTKKHPVETDVKFQIWPYNTYKGVPSLVPQTATYNVGVK